MKFNLRNYSLRSIIFLVFICAVWFTGLGMQQAGRNEAAALERKIAIGQYHNHLGEWRNNNYLLRLPPDVARSLAVWILREDRSRELWHVDQKPDWSFLPESWQALFDGPLSDFEVDEGYPIIHEEQMSELRDFVEDMQSKEEERTHDQLNPRKDVPYKTYYMELKELGFSDDWMPESWRPPTK